MRGKNTRILYEQKGFTILEVLIAISILTVGLLAVASMQVSAIRGNHLSSNVTCALALAEDKMEYLLGIDYNDASLQDIIPGNNANLDTTTTGSVDYEELNIDETGSPGGRYRRITNIANHNPATNDPIINNKAITVIVTWNQNKQKVSISSIKRL
ncbi:MAG: prepilin-type N-terminal cleavage/methylation domain-containing protein [Deltaproteobacteria bacterium]|nr:prepilin-type N-terminal cleavage/methylation domain-containing protein [Deltaproteobacteria bacterium]